MSGFIGTGDFEGGFVVSLQMRQLHVGVDKISCVGNYKLDDRLVCAEVGFTWGRFADAQNAGFARVAT